HLSIRSNGTTAIAFGPVYSDVGRDPTPCYEDIEQCDSYPEQLLLAPSDAGAWRAVEPPEFDRRASINDALVTANGDVVVALSWERTVLAVWRGGRLPTRAPEPPAEPSAPPIVDHDATLEVGATYRYPLYTHCGFPYLGFNTKTWRTDEQLPTQYPTDWPVAHQSILGQLTLVADDIIEYSIPDVGVIATYRPTDETPPGCD
ncbi:MAG: hypothetical protein SGJ13_07205, partial [Actinomycetota bacterium]|nr:hypothetical protein [Actinomycetota bacterium]